jgi:hypothetical protein
MFGIVQIRPDYLGGTVAPSASRSLSIHGAKASNSSPMNFRVTSSARLWLVSNLVSAPPTRTSDRLSGSMRGGWCSSWPSIGDQGNAGWNAGTDQSASAGTWIAYYGSEAMGDSATGTPRAKWATHRSSLGRNGQFGNFIPVREVVYPHVGWEIERIG